MSQLSEHEQQQVDIASENYEADYFNKPEAKGPLDHFKAGVDFALAHLFAGRMEKFAEWVNLTFCNDGDLNIWRELGTLNYYTTTELVAKHLQHLETIKSENAKNGEI